MTQVQDDKAELREQLERFLIGQDSAHDYTALMILNSTPDAPALLTAKRHKKYKDSLDKRVNRLLELFSQHTEKRVAEARQDQIMKDFLSYCTELDTNESLLISIRDEQFEQLKDTVEEKTHG